MFLCLPVKINQTREKEIIPLVNLIFIGINFLVYFFPKMTVSSNYIFFNTIKYSFVHVNFWHLFSNMWVLWLFGNKVNRRLGNFWYSVAYLGTAIACGIFLRLVLRVNAVGASGVIFAVITICLTLMPASRIDLLFIVFFPISLIIGLFARPTHWVYWFIRWGQFKLKALWCLLLVPALEFFNFFIWGWNWTNFGHLLGLACGIVAVLLLPKSITMMNRTLCPVQQSYKFN